MIENEVLIRKATPDDLNFIYSTWLRYFRNNSDSTRLIPKVTYFKYQQSITEKILTKPYIQIEIAYLKDDSNIIVGYLVWEKGFYDTLLHWCYVKMHFRGMGIATKLIEHSGVDLNESIFTHSVWDMGWMLERFPGMQYNPYLISEEK